MQYVERPAKSILNRLKIIDSWFWCRYTLNPYNGCEHACIYCDARSERYYLHPDFEQTIYIKINAPDLLTHHLSHTRSHLPDVVAIGGVCDAYQPAEKKYQITRQILRILYKNHYPTILSTKSTLIVRDFDLLEQIGQDTWCTAAFTVTTLDPDLAPFLEPFAASPHDRLECLAQGVKQCPHVHFGINLMPIIPLLEDNFENLEQIIAQTAAAGGEYVLAAVGVTLRDSQGEFFLHKLAEKFPALYTQFLQQFGSQCHLNDAYSHTIFSQIEQLCQKYHLSLRIPRWIPNDFRRVNYILAEHLFQESVFFSPSHPLRSSYFWAAQALHNLDHEISLSDFQPRAKTPFARISPEVLTLLSSWLPSVSPENPQQKAQKKLDQYLNK